MAGSFTARRRAKEWKISRLNVGYQKADDYTVSLKRIEFALERVKLRERRGVKGKGESGGKGWWYCDRKGRSERTVKPPFEANWLVDEFERFRSLSLSLSSFLSFSTEECTKRREERVREGKWASARVGVSTNTEMVKVY